MILKISIIKGDNNYELVPEHGLSRLKCKFCMYVCVTDENNFQQLD